MNKQYDEISIAYSNIADTAKDFADLLEKVDIDNEDQRRELYDTYTYLSQIFEETYTKHLKYKN